MVKSKYADDILSIGWGIEVLKQETIDQNEWNEENEMVINKKKSGILFLEALGNRNNIAKKYK